MKLPSTFKNKKNFWYLNKPIRQDWRWYYYIEKESRFIYFNSGESNIINHILYFDFINCCLKDFLKDYE